MENFKKLNFVYFLFLIVFSLIAFAEVCLINPLGEFTGICYQTLTIAVSAEIHMYLIMAIFAFKNSFESKPINILSSLKCALR